MTHLFLAICLSATSALTNPGLPADTTFQTPVGLEIHVLKERLDGHSDIILYHDERLRSQSLVISAMKALVDALTEHVAKLEKHVDQLGADINNLNARMRPQQYNGAGAVDIPYSMDDNVLVMPSLR